MEILYKDQKINFTYDWRKNKDDEALCEIFDVNFSNFHHPPELVIITYSISDYNNFLDTLIGELL